jgi:hypothetical protein
MRRIVVATAAIIAGLVALGDGASAQSSAPVSVFPSPGSRAALPGTQITFRGIVPGQIGAVTVVGSRTGAHTGHIEADSDGEGGSFLPDAPFVPGETVTVTTGLDVLGGSDGSFKFSTVAPWSAFGPEQIPLVPAGRHGLQHFRSRPDLLPPSITVTKRGAPAAPGDIFVAPQQGPVQNGPMLLDRSGNLVWFQPVPKNMLATDFRVQRLGTQPMLTWWQGSTNHGSGRGEDVIYNTHYQQIAAFTAGNGLEGSDLHEFLLTPQGDAYIIAVSPIHYGSSSHPFMDGVVQEIDVKTGLVLFEWHALDHIPLSESFFKRPGSTGFVYDPYHLNSVAVDRDGNLIISARNTWAAYKVDHRTGAVIWTLGSNRDSFKRGAGVATAFQHDMVVQRDGSLTVFDDGAGPPQVHSESRALRIRISTKRMTASLVKQYVHSPPLVSTFEGGSQFLGDGDMFVGWGEQPYFSEFNRAGHLDFDAHFTAPTNSYRAYRFAWSGQPMSAPAVALSRGADGISTIYASWNGATDVASWKVLAGPSPGALSSAGGARKGGFETAVHVRTEEPFLEVQAISSSRGALSTSSVTGGTGERLSVFGHSAFVLGAGGGLDVGCFGGGVCHPAATLTAGRTVVARAGSEALAANSGGIVYFSLTGAGRAMMARARGGRPAVTVSLRDGSARSSAAVELVPYHVSGAAPAYTAAQSSALQLFGRTAFVSRGRVGGVFVGCFADRPCRVRTTVTSGRAAVARTGREYIGADDCGNAIFTLTSAGRRLLTRAGGNQLPVQVTVTDGSSTATAQMALVQFI